MSWLTLGFGLLIGLGACAGDSAVRESALSEAEARLSGERGARLEIEYMTSTIDHHAMGVMMAEVCIRKAEHGDLRALCRRNAEDQAREIRLLQGWLRAWYNIEHEPEIAEADRRMVAELAQLDGATFEIRFMQTFSAHHRQMIARSRPVARQAPHAALRRFARHVIEEQSRDVRLMRGWLCTWYDRCREGDAT